MNSNQIARQDSTLLALIIQATERNASIDIIEKYVKLLTLESSKTRANEIIKENFNYAKRI